MVDFTKDHNIIPEIPQDGVGGRKEIGKNERGVINGKNNADAGRPNIPPGADQARKSKIVNIGRYQDPGGLTPQKMAVGLWYVEHRQIFVKIILYFLLLISAVSWVYTFYHVISYVAVGLKQDQKMIDELVQSSLISHDYLVQIGPRNLQFDPVQVIKENGDDTYDFLAQIKNPNKRYIAKFEYYFTTGEKTYGQASGFILPEETKHLIALGQKIGTQPNESRLFVYNLQWTRVNPHIIPDWPEYRNDRLDIAVENVVFTPAADTTLTEKLSLNDLKFTVVNNTAYNYQIVDFHIFLVGYNQIIGVNKYLLDKFKSGQTENIAMTWSGKFGPVNRVMIVPEIDITRDDIYFKFENE